MKKIYFLIVFTWMLLGVGAAMPIQNPSDSLKIDSIKKAAILVAEKNKDSVMTANYIKVYQNNLFFNLNVKAEKPTYSLKKVEKSNDIFFYAVMGLLLLFGILRSGFSKYFSDFFSFTFKTTLKKNQIKQQLLQNNLPSLLFNVLFFISFSFYVLLLITKLFEYHPLKDWYLFALLFAGFMIVYLLKFVQLKLIGWMFRVKDITNAYIFLIFYVNKALGIFLLPIIFVLALAQSKQLLSVWTLSWILIGIFILYRIVMTFRLYFQLKKGSVFQFLIYSVSLEIIPFLILVKAISNYLK